MFPKSENRSAKSGRGLRVLLIFANLLVLPTRGPSQDNAPTSIQSTSLWTVPMAITLTDATQDSVAFGTRMSATDGLDAGIDALNPPPPPNVFDAFFQISHPVFPQLSKDFRSDTSITHEWKLLIVATNGDSGTVTWNASEFPTEAKAALRLQTATADTTLDMLTEDSLGFVGDQVITITADLTTRVENKLEVPRDFLLFQNYPNPFNPETNIEYELAQAGQVHLAIYNLLGQRVRTLVDEWQPAGSYRMVWDGSVERGTSSAPSGIYVYELKVRDRILRKKMLLLR